MLGLESERGMERKGEGEGERVRGRALAPCAPFPAPTLHCSTLSLPVPALTFELVIVPKLASATASVADL